MYLDVTKIKSAVVLSNSCVYSFWDTGSGIWIFFVWIVFC